MRISKPIIDDINTIGSRCGGDRLGKPWLYCNRRSRKVFILKPTLLPGEYHPLGMRCGECWCKYVVRDRQEDCLICLNCGGPLDGFEDV